MTANINNITSSSANQDQLHDTDAAETRRALADLLPPERCSLDGRIPHDPVRPRCGHVYCKICLQDIAVTAALLGELPTCKTCFTPFQIGLPTLDEVRRRNGLSTGIGYLFPDDNQYVGMMPNTIGARAQETLINGGGSSLPWVPPSQRTQVLVKDYTRVRGEASLLLGQTSDPVALDATQIVVGQNQPELHYVDSDAETPSIAFPSQRATGEIFDFGDLFDLENASQPMEDPHVAWNFGHTIPPESFPNNVSNLVPGTSADNGQQIASGRQSLRLNKVSQPQAQDGTAPVPIARPLPSLPSSNRQSESPQPGPLDFATCNGQLATTPQPSSITSISPQRDISILAGQRFCFKGKLLNQAAMEAAVGANGGIVTGGGFKHTTYGIVGSGWRITPSWERNGVQVLNENGFWELLESKTRERQSERSQPGV